LRRTERSVEVPRMCPRSSALDAFLELFTGH
jgi:hypothetical protein